MRVGRIFTAVLRPSLAPDVKASKYPLFPNNIKHPAMQIMQGIEREEIYSSIFRRGDLPFA